MIPSAEVSDSLPQQFAPHPYGPQYPQPYMYPPQQMQTVFVNNNGGRRVNHVLHLVLTILTAGLWLPIWIILAIAIECRDNRRARHQDA